MNNETYEIYMNYPESSTFTYDFIDFVSMTISNSYEMIINYEYDGE